MTAFFKERLSTYLIENKDAANKIMEQVLINKRSRENAEKTRQSIKTNLQQKTDMANRVQKFIDCRSKDKSRREIYIVEGDSAAGAIRTSRDAEFQGVMPVRGKILNCLKEDYPRIFKSDIIMDLMRVLGCGVEIKDKRIKNLGAFDLDNLNWNKVIICTDADVDGYHIRTLVLTMLYRLVPTLIDEATCISPSRRSTRSTAKRRPTLPTPSSRKTASSKRSATRSVPSTAPRVLVKTILT
mgnify:CR=1 FL=1